MNIIETWSNPVNPQDEHDLLEHLQTPLTDAEKIPTTEAEYNSLLNDSIDKSVVLLSKDLNKLFRLSTEETASDLYTRLVVRVVENNPRPDGTEQSYIPFWDDIIGRTLDLILTGTAIRNSSKGTSTGTLRPDYGFLIKGHCLFRGEEKAPGSEADPVLEIETKLDAAWTYGNLSYVLGESHAYSKLTKSKGAFLRLCRHWNTTPISDDHEFTTQGNTGWVP